MSINYISTNLLSYFLQHVGKKPILVEKRRAYLFCKNFAEGSGENWKKQFSVLTLTTPQ